MKATFPVLALTLCLAAGASAGTFTIQGLALPSTAQVHVTGTGVQTSDVFAGPENASLDGGASFRVFCADLGHFSNGSPTPVSLVNTSTMSAGYQMAAQLYNKFAPTVGDDQLLNAGLQVAIWKSIYGADATITDVTAGVIAQSQIMLTTDLTGVSNVATYYDLGGVNQSMIGGGTPQAVPEPASMAALGLGALGLLKRRKK